MTHRRRGRRTLGVVLLLLALTGVVGIPAWPVGASGDADGAHETMHRMMDAMHGEGTSDRLHGVEGTEGMMETCAAMMEAMHDDGARPGGMMQRGGMMGMMR